MSSSFRLSPDRKRDGEADAHLRLGVVSILVTDTGLTDPGVDGEVLADLPDRADESGDDVRLADGALVENLGHGSHRRVERALENGRQEEIGVALARERRLGV